MPVSSQVVEHPAPPPRELSAAEKMALQKQEQTEKMDALRRKVRTLREGAMFNRMAVVNAEPGKVYVWVNIREERQISYQAMSWELCTKPELTKFWKPEESRHRRADLILYEMPRELYEAICADNIIRGLEAGGDQVEQNFAAAVQKLGSRTFEPRVGGK